MTKLIYLDLSFNQFSIYPYREGQLPCLTTLSIIGNPIELLPKFISKSKIDEFYFDWAVDIDRIYSQSSLPVKDYTSQLDLRISKSTLTELYRRYIICITQL